MPETLYSLGRAVLVLGRVIQLEKESPLAAEAYLALAGVHRKQGTTGEAARDIQEYRRVRALHAYPR